MGGREYVIPWLEASRYSVGELPSTTEEASCIASVLPGVLAVESSSRS